MKRIAIITCILALTAACTPISKIPLQKQWVKTGATPADLQKAKAECEFEAAKSDVTMFKVTLETELQQAQLIDLCLRAKGYEKKES
jgi:hypothetical protein